VLQVREDYAKRIRARRGQLGDRWHLDEVYLKIGGRLEYLWRAVDQDGSVLDILVQPPETGSLPLGF
jgi:putative transposase